jgi:hypothetical protein
VATPAGEDAGHPSWLFTQTFRSGDWARTDDPTHFTLHLRGGLTSTVGFTDRPNRDFGVWTTTDFIPQLWDDPTNPPNAAIIVDDAGTQYTFLLVLTDPSYDEAADEITYTVSVLASYEGDGLGEVVERVADGTLPQTFGAGAIFIDSLFGCNTPYAMACRQVITSSGWGCGSNASVITGYLEESIQTPATTCKCYGGCNCPCDSAQATLNAWCNTTFPDYCYGNGSQYCVFMTYDKNYCA